MTAPERASLAIHPLHRGLVDPTDGGLSWLSWWLDVHVNLFKLTFALGLAERLLLELSWNLG
jgi:hypothetical protein